MKNNILQLKSKKKGNSIRFEDLKDRNATFSVSKWNTIHLEYKLIRHGNITCYVDYLIDKYAVRVYQGIDDHQKFDKIRTNSGLKDRILVQCRVCEGTLSELNELAVYVSITKLKMFRILFEWDIGIDRPALSQAVGL